MHRTEAHAMTRGEAMGHARRMYGDGRNGWTIEAIRQYLAGHGVIVGWNTVKRWADPVAGEAALIAHRARARAREREKDGVRIPRVLDQDGLLLRIRALDGAGVPASSIAKVLRLDHDLDMPDYAVRLALVDGELPARVAKRLVA